jgi:hypothetical protein
MMLNRSLIIAAAVMVLVSAPVWSAQQPVAAKSLSVNQLAAKPDAFVGKVAVVGRVAAATSGKGFTLIDSVNCATCTTECLTDKTTKKIPFLWSGAAPLVKDVVRVDGILAKTAKGYTFTAERVVKQ